MSDEAPHNNFNRFERLVCIVFSDIFDFGNIDDEKKNKCDALQAYKYITLYTVPIDEFYTTGQIRIRIRCLF